MIIIIIIIILLIIFLLLNKKSEYFYAPETKYIENVICCKENLIENIKLEYNKENVYLIPQYISDKELKIISLNFTNEKQKINIKINNVNKTIEINKLYDINNISDNNFNFTKKREKKIMIPKTIVQTAKTRNVTEHKYLSIRSIIDNNPNYNYEFYDDNECANFIEKHFEKNVLEAYKNLVPGAYKADLFRYCYLYIKGGVYVDCKMICHINFDDLIDMNDTFIVVSDVGPNAYWNGFICAKPGLELFKKCIDQIVLNVKNHYYGKSSLDITGPTLFYEKAQQYISFINTKILNFYHIKHGDPKNYLYINYENKLLSISYPTYYEENDYKVVDHYGKHWTNRTVYAK